MIDPANITKFNRTREELEEWALFATLVAGKPAGRTARLLENFLNNSRLALGYDLTPFELVRTWVRLGRLEQQLRRYGTGQYDRLVRCWTQLTALVPARMGHSTMMEYAVPLGDVRALEQVHGIGPKTARFIVLHSVRGARYIPIDTHWLKELRERGYDIKVSSSDGQVSMTRLQYERYEQHALEVVDRAGLTAAEADLMIWRKWNARGNARLAA